MEKIILKCMCGLIPIMTNAPRITGVGHPARGVRIGNAKLKCLCGVVFTYEGGEEAVIDRWNFLHEG